MIQSARDPLLPQELNADICIVGAGAAGITLAAELNDSGISVLLLESGGLKLEPQTQKLYRGSVDAKATRLHREFLEHSRLRQFGGTTNHWSGWCMPLDEQDFERRDWIPHSGWPLNAAELKPFYDRASPYCDIDPYNRKKIKAILNEEPLIDPESSGIQPILFFFSAPTRFGSKYREVFEKSKNVRVLLHANLLELVPHSDGKRIETGRCKTLSGKTFEVRARIFVLACGGLENPRILLNSRSGNPAGLGNERDLVGRFYMDHPNLTFGTPYPARYLLWAAHKKYHLFREPVTVPGLKNPVTANFGTTAEFQRRSRSSSVTFDFSLLRMKLMGQDASDLERSLGQALPLADSELNSTAERSGLPFAFDEQGRQYNPVLGNLLIRSEQVPNPESRVTLTRRKDALGQQQMKLKWFLSDQDYESMYAALWEFGRALMLNFRGRLNLPSREKFRELRPNTGWHHMGTTRMSATPDQGVVDANCKIHGLANAYIAGGSVFPTVGHANPTYTIVALAVRLADHLKNRNKTS